MPDKVIEQLFLPTSWEDARPELVRKQFESARAINPMIDGRIYQARTVIATGSMVESDGVILADASAGAFTISALAADQAKNKVIRVKKIDPGANLVIVKPAGSDTIEGAAAATLAAQYASLTLYSDGSSKWWSF